MAQFQEHFTREQWTRKPENWKKPKKNEAQFDPDQPRNPRRLHAGQPKEAPTETDGEE